MKLLDSIQDGFFTLSIECTPHNAGDVRRVAELARALPELNRKYAPHRLAIAGITLTQNPGGNRSYDHHAALALLRASGFPAELEIVPHVTGKDMNVDALTALLQSLAEAGIGTLLALTGDVPAGRGVFELESLGMLQLVREVNVDLLKTARTPAAFAAVPQLRAGAAVSPFKYTEGSLAMQIIKAAKKVREGAAFLVCQAGWDAARSEQLIGELRGENVPLLGNVLLADEAAARFMKELPGCVVTDALLKRLQADGSDGPAARAAQQLAMFRALGYAGADLGKPGDFQSAAEIEAIVDRALAIPDWRAFRDNLTFAPPPAPAPKVSRSAAVSHVAHRVVLDENGALHGVAKALLRPVNTSAEREGALYRLFKRMENAGKEAVYECEHCGDCFLPENEYVCTMGQCEKGLANVPCGDADPTGHCGNNKNRVCVGEKVYQRLLKYESLETFKRATMPRRRPELRGTPSVLNHFFGRNHTAHPNPLAGSGLIQIAELIHASVPLAGAALKFVQGLGEDGFVRPNRGRLMLEYLIRTQAAEGADYIDLNIDALGAGDPPAFMRRMVRLVHECGGGTPPCIDSSDPAVLEAGLDEWLGLGAGLRPPLVNSVTYSEADRYEALLARRRERPFGVVGLLVGKEGPMKTTDAMVDSARSLFGRFTRAGFAPAELFFDTVTLGIGTDGFMDAEGNVKSSHTRNSFQAIRRIRDDAEMKGVHALLGVSNWVFGARKRRIGHLRAFIAVAQEYGLDAAISDTGKLFGCRPAPPELMDFVRMFIALDGTDASMDLYTEGMAKARENAWV